MLSVIENPVVRYQKILSDREYKYMFLYYLSEWTQPEIAEHYNITTSGVSKIIKLGIKKLQRIMHEEDWNVYMR